MELCLELGGMTLAEMDARMGAGELTLWKAKSQVDGFIEDKMRRHQVNRQQALDLARADHRAVVARRERRR